MSAGEGTLESYCGSIFWDNQLSWNTTTPDLTPCFEWSCLLWVACGFYWVFFPFHYASLLGSKEPPLQHSRFSASRTVLALLLFIVAFTDFSYALYQWKHDGVNLPNIYYVSPVIIAGSMVLVMINVQLDRRAGLRGTGLPCLFFLLLFLQAVAVLQTDIREAVKEGGVDEKFRFSLICLYFLFVTMSFLLGFSSDPAETCMEEIGRPQNPCKQKTSSFFSNITYGWCTSLCILGYRKALENKDLWDLNTEDTCQRLVPEFEAKWNKEIMKLKRSKAVRRAEQEAGLEQSPAYTPSVFMTLVRAYGPLVAYASVLKIFSDLMQFIAPQLLKYLIAFTSNPAEPLWRGFFYTVLMFMSGCVQSILTQLNYTTMLRVGLRIRSALTSIIYKKALTMSNAAKKSSTAGEIVNLMSVDAQRLMDLMNYVCMLWSAPIQIALALYFLWQELGVSVLAGLAVMLLLIPINGVLAAFTRKFQTRQLKLKDQRIKLVNEVLNGMKVLKLYAWELPFQQQILAIREKELWELKKISLMNASISFSFTCAPFMVALMSFLAYVLSNPSHVLTADKAFVSLSLFNIMRIPLAALPIVVMLTVQVSLLSFMVFVLIDEKNVLTADRAFVSLSLFNILRLPLTMLPLVISQSIQASVSVKRLNHYFSHDEISKGSIDHDESATAAIMVDNGTFSWDVGEPTLSNINLEVRSGSLTAVVGQVGSGKSSLLSALLGEMEKHIGKVNVKGSVAYAAQQAWIQNATLRDNITFNKRYSASKYDQVISACALAPDFEILPGGDLTEIGEKGINLSGGQKQRVSLARAVYNDTDIMMFDDPLSAVDAHVGKHIFDNVIGPQGMLKNKTRLLTTNAISFLPQVDQIVVMIAGRISEVGTYKQLLYNNGAFAEFLRSYLTNPDNEDAISDSEVDHEVVGEILAQVAPEYTRLSSRLSTVSSGEDSQTKRKMSRQITRVKSQMSRAKSQMSQMPDGVPGLDLNKLIEAEGVETGQVKATIYLTYLRYVSTALSITMVGSFALQNVANVASSLWLSAWSNDEQNPDGTQDIPLRNIRLSVYSVLGLAQAVAALAGAIALAYGAVRASRFLHHNCLLSLMRSPMTFFDTTPLGRIVNRMAKDVDIIDNTLPMNFSQFLSIFFSVMGAIIIIVISTWYFIFVAIPLGVLYFFIQRFYIATTRQLKRLESVSRSPIYTHFSETVTGASTIRAYRVQDTFMSENENRVDINQMSYFPNVMSNRWLGVRLEFLGNLVVVFAALFAVISKATGSISAGVVGLSVSYAMTMTQLFYWMIRLLCELESTVVAVERVNEYSLNPDEITQSLSMLIRVASDVETNIVAVERVAEYSKTPQEAPWSSGDTPGLTPPPEYWPSEGDVVFQDYSLRYRTGLPLVLKKVTCHISGQEKIGICGRTGAGKSSLTLALFRLIEASAGEILIDGRNVAQMGLHELRSKLTIIPQDPVLFSGDLRMNLDPFGWYTDDAIWLALEHAHLKTFVASLPEGLAHEVSEGGENLSVGQRQLVCLARALLRKTKVLILDEATAAIDLETDDLIQETIRREFADCTVLTIAHRLNTIMDSSRVMVLDQGVIAEFDSPENLLANPDSIFYSLAKEAGIHGLSQNG